MPPASDTHRWPSQRVDLLQAGLPTCQVWNQNIKSQVADFLFGFDSTPLATVGKGNKGWSFVYNHGRLGRSHSQHVSLEALKVSF